MNNVETGWPGSYRLVRPDRQHDKREITLKINRSSYTLTGTNIYLKTFRLTAFTISCGRPNTQWGQLAWHSYIFAHPVRVLSRPMLKKLICIGLSVVESEEQWSWMNNVETWWPGSCLNIFLTCVNQLLFFNWIEHRKESLCYIGLAYFINTIYCCCAFYNVRNIV